MAGLVLIDGEYYFAYGANGEIAVNKDQYIWKNETAANISGTQHFGADGKMVKN